MAEFYLERPQSSDADHLIHFDSCTAMPAVAQMRYLGSVANYEGAKAAARRAADKVNACSVCAADFVVKA